MAGRKSAASNIKMPDVNDLFEPEQTGSNPVEKVEKWRLAGYTPSIPIPLRCWMMKRCRRPWRASGSMALSAP